MIKYFLNEPYLSEKEKEYVLDVLDSGWLSSQGKHTKIFEEKFAEMVGVKYALAVQSGTAALHTALLALNIGEGDKVVTPNFTCGACATSVLQTGATPVILDVENETFCLDASILEDYIKREGRPAAVMLVHVYGFPARDLEKIIEICKREDIFLIEDCSEAHGAEYNGKKVGSFGIVSVFSVRSEKMIGVGEGGLILTNNRDIINRSLYWASRAAPYRNKKDPYWYKYLYTGVGMNYLMPHLLGAVGRAQIENFPNIMLRKKLIGERYQSLFMSEKGVQLQRTIQNTKPVYWLNTIILKDKSKIEVRRLGEILINNGLEIRPTFWPLGNQPIFERYSWGMQNVGNFLFENGIVMPSTAVSLSENNCRGVEEIFKIFKESQERKIKENLVSFSLTNQFK